MKTLLSLIIICLFSTQIQAQEVNILARINDQVITDFDVKKRHKLINAINQESDRNNPLTKNLQEKIISDMINEILQINEAAKQNITITDEDVIYDIKLALAQVNEDLEKVKRNLSKRSVAYKDYFQYMKVRSLWLKLIKNTIIPQINITQSQLDDYINQQHIKEKITFYNLGFIHIPINMPDAKEVADKINNQIKLDGNFDKIAESYYKQYSRSKFKTNWMQSQDIIDLVGQEQYQQINQLQNDQISNLFISTSKFLNGYNIVKLFETKTNYQPNEIKSLILQEKTQIKIKEYLTKLKQDNFIEIYL